MREEAVVSERSLGGVGDQLGLPGGQGIVKALLDDETLVYKRYHGPLEDHQGLDRLILWRRNLDASRREFLDERCAWPLARVVDDAGTATVGMLMNRAVPRFVSAADADGTQRLRSLAHLLRPERAMQQGIESPHLVARLRLARELAELFRFFEDEDIVYLDVSEKNVLWSIEPAPRVYLLDCDNAAVAGQATHGAVTTRAWRDPRTDAGAPPDRESARFALGLFVFRTYFATSQSVANIIEVRDAHDWVPAGWPLPPLLEASLRHALNPQGNRPDAHAWVLTIDNVLPDVPPLSVVGKAKLGPPVDPAGPEAVDVHAPHDGVPQAATVRPGHPPRPAAAATRPQHSGRAMPLSRAWGRSAPLATQACLVAPAIVRPLATFAVAIVVVLSIVVIDVGMRRSGGRRRPTRRTPIDGIAVATKVSGRLQWSLAAIVVAWTAYTGAAALMDWDRTGLDLLDEWTPSFVVPVVLVVFLRTVLAQATPTRGAPSGACSIADGLAIRPRLAAASALTCAALFAVSATLLPPRPFAPWESGTDLGSSMVANGARNKVVRLVAQEARLGTPWFGVTTVGVSDVSRSAYDVRVDHGALVTSTMRGSPAEGVKLLPGDVITKLNGAEISGPAQLAQTIDGLEPNDELDIEVNRKGVDLVASIRLSTRPANAH